MAEQEHQRAGPDLKLRRRSDERAKAEADRAFAVLWFALLHNITAEEAAKVMPEGWRGPATT